MLVAGVTAGGAFADALIVGAIVGEVVDEVVGAIVGEDCCALARAENKIAIKQKCISAKFGLKQRGTTIDYAMNRSIGSGNLIRKNVVPMLSLAERPSEIAGKSSVSQAFAVTGDSPSTEMDPLRTSQHTGC